MDELEVMQNAKLMLLHSIKFKALTQAMFNVNKELFAEYEKVFREMEATNEELKQTQNAIDEIIRSRN